MTKKTPEPGRDAALKERRKAALRANLQRRKAQARARDVSRTDGKDGAGKSNEQKD